jgi:transposase
LKRGGFIWSQATGGVVALTRAHLLMLLKGIDWRATTKSPAAPTVKTARTGRLRKFNERASLLRFLRL